MVLGNIVSGKRKTLKSETAVKAVAGVSSPYAAEYTAKVAKAVRMGAVAHMAELTMFKIWYFRNCFSSRSRMASNLGGWEKEWTYEVFVMNIGILRRLKEEKREPKKSKGVLGRMGTIPNLLS